MTVVNAKRPGRRTPPAPDGLAVAYATIRKLEAEIDNLKDFSLKLAARTLKLELAVSAHLPEARGVVFPEDPKPDKTP